MRVESNAGQTFVSRTADANAERPLFAAWINPDDKAISRTRLSEGRQRHIWPALRPSNACDVDRSVECHRDSGNPAGTRPTEISAVEQLARPHVNGRQKAIA